MRRELAACVVVLSVGAIARAADSREGRWAVSVQGGTDVEMSGHPLLASEGAIAGLPVTAQGLSWRGAYGSAFRGAASLSYGVASRVEVFGRGGRYAMEGASAPIGSASGLQMTAQLGRYEEWTAEAGARYFVTGGSRWQPYVALTAGARFLSAVPVTLAVPDARLEARDLPLFDKSTVAVFGLDGGVARRLSGRLAVGLEIGLRYQTAPAGLDSGLAGSGLEVMNDGGSRWSLPVSLRIAFRL
jgi:hypothetical protein